MTLHAPKASKPKVLAQGFGKCLAMQTFTYPDGRAEEFYLWMYLKKPGSVIFAVTEDKQVILVRQFRHGANDFLLEVAGGAPNAGESPEQAASRELLEETGYQADQIIDLKARPWVLASWLNVRLYSLLATGCRKVAEPLNTASEETEVVLIPLRDFYQMASTGQILDGPTMTLAMLALPRLGGKILF